MHDIIAAALNAAQLAGASYADARIVDSSREEIQVASGIVEGVEHSDSFGIGVRALVAGAWGFSATRVVTAEEAVSVARHRQGLCAGLGRARGAAAT